MYEAARRKVPETDDPEFGEVHATITVAIDENSRFKVYGNGTEEFRNAIQNTSWALQEILSNFREFIDWVEKQRLEEAIELVEESGNAE